jgi:hypothetical protein
MNSTGVVSPVLSQSPQGLPMLVPSPSGVVLAARQSMKRVMLAQCRSNTRVSR